MGKNSCKDMLAWYYSKDGIYSVKSRYRAAKDLSKSIQNRRGRLLVGESSGENNFNWFNCVWSFNVQNKIKLFIWHACSNILPCGDIMFKRKVVNHNLCPYCGLETETIFHALWTYKNAKSIWKLAHSSGLLFNT